MERKAGRFRTILLLIASCFAGFCAHGSDSIKEAGDVLQFVIPVTAAGMTAVYRDGQGAIQFAEAFGTTMAITYALKYSVNEKRPNGGNQSFPSGHTSASFAGAEFIRKRYGWEYGVPAYAAAAFVGYSRVETREHYPHDVLAGAAIGIGSSFIFTKPYKGWRVQADGDSKYIGLRIERAW